MLSPLARHLLIPLLCVSFAVGQSAQPQSAQLADDGKVPSGVIIVKGAWSSASDSTTPVPEGGSVTNGVYRNDYFGMTYSLPHNWTEEYKGPPPSDHGRYVLAQIAPPETFTGSARGSILMTAEDMFFTPVPAKSAAEFVNYSKDHLQPDYKVEQLPQPITLAGRNFTFLKYWSPVAELHWFVLATEIRCHTVEIVLSSRDSDLLQSLMRSLQAMKLPDETGSTAERFPVCIKHYATEANLINRVEPVFNEARFNPVPVRIIIDKSGSVRHIHFLSAFPDQAQAITAALKQWKFRPHVENGKVVEVETGIMFGRGGN
ncbi:MAG TPA: hypothetical protein VF753_02900 [Terriglobales bacterium]